MKLLENKKVLITGGSRGIGAAIVKQLVDHGAHVGFTYISPSSQEASEKLAEACRQSGQQIKTYMSNAANFAEAEQLIQQFMADFGQIDVLINNAGITRDTLMLRMTEAQWDEVINVNLKSVFNLTKHALRPMLKAQQGSIINMSSVVGVFGNAGQANYAASKAGIIGFTKSIAKEVGSRNIRCNAIAPGFIGTDMTEELDEKTKENFMSNIPLKRLGSGTDVANTVLFLSSDMSNYVTGQVISVCGGMNM